MCSRPPGHIPGDCPPLRPISLDAALAASRKPRDWADDTADEIAGRDSAVFSKDPPLVEIIAAVLREARTQALNEAAEEAAAWCREDSITERSADFLAERIRKLTAGGPK